MQRYPNMCVPRAHLCIKSDADKYACRCVRCVGQMYDRQEYLVCISMHLYIYSWCIWMYVSYLTLIYIHLCIYISISVEWRIYRHRKKTPKSTHAKHTQKRHTQDTRTRHTQKKDAEDTGHDTHKYTAKRQIDDTYQRHTHQTHIKETRTGHTHAPDTHTSDTQTTHQKHTHKTHTHKNARKHTHETRNHVCTAHRAQT